MAGPSEVLREYLLALGFRIDKKEAKDFDTAIDDIGKTAKFAGIALVGLAGTAATMAQVYANSMEKVYYASRHSGASVQNLQALAYAGKQVGVDTSAGVEAMVRALRDPGKLGRIVDLLRSQLGLDDKRIAELLKDPAALFPKLVQALKKTDPNLRIRQSYASTLGLDKDQYADYEKVVDELEREIDEYNKMLAATGVNSEEVAKAMHEWNQNVGRVFEGFKLLAGVLAISLLPQMREIAKLTESWLTDAIKAITAIKKEAPTWGSGGKVESISMALSGNTGMAAPPPVSKDGTTGFFNAGARATLQRWGDWFRGFWHGGRDAVTASAASTPQPPSGYSKQQIDDAISNFADAYGVPESLIRAIAQVESGGGKNLVSPTGVRGLTQITAYNAKRLGKDRNDPIQSLEMTAMMLKENYASTGSWDKAAWMYSGNGSSPLGSAPAGGDPRYLDKVHAAIQQTNNITVNGGDVGKITHAVGDALDKSNGDLLRNSKGGLQ